MTLTHSLEKTQKGEQRSVWELLMQLRVLLPYLARLTPLLDKGLGKTSRELNDLNDLHRSLAEMQTGNRELAVQARSQALQMERLEGQMARFRVAQENAAEESGRLSDEVRALRRLILALGVAILVLLLITAGLVSFLLIRP